MPEGVEITILSQYLKTKLHNRILFKCEILGGKYKRNVFDNYDLLNTNKYRIIDIDSKGKLLWMTLENMDNKKIIYMTSHLGLTGFWSFEKPKTPKIQITIEHEKKDVYYYLYYEDDRNFGNINIYLEKEELQDKIDELAHDALKEDYKSTDFIEWTKKYLSKSEKRGEQYISIVLMNQKQSDGIICGIGNYLMAEILYHAKISPFRKMNTLTNTDLTTLCNSIQYITKLSYYNNTTGYMTHFGDFITLHKERIDNGTYPNYHKHIDLKNKEFKFSVYRQEKDPYGNDVKIDKTIQKNRSTYWVFDVQK
ncbi:formamidopyrimidine-DNA glycosylase [Bodo saltans virus]|uniref:Formamidopyrimidine-DNA glycosylase n=1 Tax=Bodo saltans virus TaxID=2024608 RepID=A0A2H4UVF0_9VIRU|nr:formamidopyrimidine-DNA glycosylase [Bodo saltans virus]ATZ80891.1 formamidopyrimidine-DNA glycosylase [Bodo saltans virus]